MDRNPAPILEALVLLDHREEPTLDLLLGKHPELVRLDWINRWGPHQAWPPILAPFTTPQLAYLAKALTVLERDLNWIGGSVAATIWIFRAYRERKDGDVDALASWIVDNGTNPWSPWGSRCFARTLGEFDGQQSAAQQARLEFEKKQQQRKEENRRIAQAAAIVRRNEGKERAERVKLYMRHVEALGARDRLIFLATDETFPLEVIPQNLITSSLSQALELPAKNRMALLARLDRRKASRWRRLRKALAG